MQIFISPLPPYSKRLKPIRSKGFSLFLLGDIYARGLGRGLAVLLGLGSMP